MTAVLGLLLTLLLALAPILASVPAGAHGQDMAVTLADPGAEIPAGGALPGRDQAGWPCSSMPACPMIAKLPTAVSSSEPGPPPRHSGFVPLVRPAGAVQPDLRPPIA